MISSLYCSAFVWRKHPNVLQPYNRTFSISNWTHFARLLAHAPKPGIPLPPISHILLILSLIPSSPHFNHIASYRLFLASTVRLIQRSAYLTECLLSFLEIFALNSLIFVMYSLCFSRRNILITIEEISQCSFMEESHVLRILLKILCIFLPAGRRRYSEACRSIWFLL